MNISAEWLAHIVTIIGLPFAIGTYIYENRKEWTAQEEKLFDELDDGYISFMNLAITNTDLDIFSKPLDQSYRPSEEQLAREEAIYGILISLFERCYLMFKNKSKNIRESQWDGWVSFMQNYTNRHSFDRVWAEIGHQFDKDFQSFIATMLNDTKEN